MTFLYIVFNINEHVKSIDFGFVWFLTLCFSFTLQFNWLHTVPFRKTSMSLSLPLHAYVYVNGFDMSPTQQNNNRLMALFVIYGNSIYIFLL